MLKYSGPKITERPLIGLLLPVEISYAFFVSRYGLTALKCG